MFVRSSEDGCECCSIFDRWMIVLMDGVCK